MINVSLKNNQTIQVSNESSPIVYVVYTDTFAEIDPWKQLLTPENLNGGTFDGKPINNLVFSELYVTMSGGKIKTDFIFREKTELDLLKERIAEQEEVMNFLLMQQ